MILLKLSAFWAFYTSIFECGRPDMMAARTLVAVAPRFRENGLSAAGWIVVRSAINPAPQKLSA